MAKAKRIPTSKISFGDAVTEVEEILARLEKAEIDIDELGAEVGRAVELIRVCRDKLKRTEKEVSVLVDGLQAPDDGRTPPDAPADPADAIGDGDGDSDRDLPF